MENFLRKPIEVPFSSLYLDPNNPRLAREDHPGYADADALFDPDLQKELESVVRKDHDVDGLITAIVTQGWMPIDAIVVWKFPGNGARFIVMEGNRRTVALRDLRNVVLPREVKKLESLKKKKAIAKHDLETQAALVKQIERVIADTDKIVVVPLDAANIEELKAKLPRVLAVRHIQGARGWGNYAEDLWLLERYTTLFQDAHPGEELRWDATLIARVAHEASLGDIKARRQLQAAAAFSHFRVQYEDELPDGETFSPTDYYLFENIVKKPWLREQFGFAQDAFRLERENVLFKWVFAEPRGHTADDNPNVFYRHENVLVWEKMHRYDVENQTDFASRFDIDEPDSAPKMNEVEAAFLMHKARSAPSEVLEQLLAQIAALTQETLATQADFLKPKLEAVIDRCEQCIAMMDAAQRAPAHTVAVRSRSSGRTVRSGRRS
jgi:hypothetical protein